MDNDDLSGVHRLTTLASSCFSFLLQEKMLLPIMVELTSSNGGVAHMRVRPAKIGWTGDWLDSNEVENWEFPVSFKATDVEGKTIIVSYGEDYDPLKHRRGLSRDTGGDA